MTRLRTCEACLRHVLVHENACPFCQRALTPVVERPVAPYAPGLSRAQRLAVAAAAMASQALVACEQNSVPIYGAPATPQPTAAAGAAASGSGGIAGRQPTQAGAGANAGAVAVPVYGAPLAGRPSPAGSGGSDGPVAMPVYGAPIAGRPSPAGAGGNAGANNAGASSAGTGGQDGDLEDAGTQQDAGPTVHPVYGAPFPVDGPTPKS